MGHKLACKRFVLVLEHSHKDVGLEHNRKCEVLDKLDGKPLVLGSMMLQQEQVQDSKMELPQLELEPKRSSVLEQSSKVLVLVLVCKPEPVRDNTSVLESHKLELVQRKRERELGSKLELVQHTREPELGSRFALVHMLKQQLAWCSMEMVQACKRLF